MSSAPPTPPAFSRAPSYLSFVPRRARTGALGASFDNLVALADAQEALAHAARAARPAVWRARGEPAAELASVRECARHAARGAASESAGMAGGGRRDAHVRRALRGALAIFSAVSVCVVCMATDLLPPRRGRRARV
jgi:hypothetical protein